MRHQGLYCWRWTKDKYYQYKYTHKKYLLLLAVILFLLSICELILDLSGKLMSKIFYYLKEESDASRRRRYEQEIESNRLRQLYRESAAINEGAAFGAARGGYLGTVRTRQQIQYENARRKNFERFMFWR